AHRHATLEIRSLNPLASLYRNRKPKSRLKNSQYTKEEDMATALPILEIQEPGADLARKTVFIKLHLGLLGNSRKVSSSQVEVDADKELIRAAKFRRVIAGCLRWIRNLLVFRQMG